VRPRASAQGMQLPAPQESRSGNGSYAAPGIFWLWISGSVKAPSGGQNVTSIASSSTRRRSAAPAASKYADPNVYSGSFQNRPKKLRIWLAFLNDFLDLVV